MSVNEPIHEATVTTPADDAAYFNCAQCGARLTFQPGAESLQCGHCGEENAIDRETVAIDELDFGAHLARLAEQVETTEVTIVKCGACGVEMDRPPDLDAYDCPYCGTDIVATGTTERVIKPRAVLPFHVTREAARAAFGTWVRSRWFAPTKLKRYARADHRLEGVYVPYWTYDCRTTADYTGMRGEHYWVTRKTKNGTRRVRKTRWYPAAGTVHNTFDDVLVLASQSLPRTHAEKLEPWDLQSLAPYQDDYLAGFRAEKYQVSLEDGFTVAKGIMEGTIRATVNQDIGGDEQQIASLRVRHDDITFKHILLPIWITAYRFRERAYRILVNARTGEVQGERPWSFWKIFFAAAGAAVGVAIIALIVGAAQ